MATTTFRGVKIEDWTGKHNDTGQKFELFMVADFSDKVREDLGWHAETELTEIFPELREKDTRAFDKASMIIPANVKSMGLDGDLEAKEIELIPNDKDRKDKGIKLICSRVKNFSLNRIKLKKGSFDWQLRFTAVVVGSDAAKKIAKYLDDVGSRIAQMKVGYNENKQGTLDGMEGGEKPAAAENGELPGITATDEQREATSEAADAPGDRGPALASAREVGEGRRGPRGPRKLAPVN